MKKVTLVLALVISFLTTYGQTEAPTKGILFKISGGAFGRKYLVLCPDRKLGTLRQAFESHTKP